jgi:hypothetical protein
MNERIWDSFETPPPRKRRVFPTKIQREADPPPHSHIPPQQQPGSALLRPLPRLATRAGCGGRRDLPLRPASGAQCARLWGNGPCMEPPGRRITSALAAARVPIDPSYMVASAHTASTAEHTEHLGAGHPTRSCPVRHARFGLRARSRWWVVVRTGICCTRVADGPRCSGTRRGAMAHCARLGGLGPVRRSGG